MSISTAVLIATTLCIGLMAGLFYSYSCSVVPGLGKLSDTEYITAMQSINRAIQNPVFFIAFFGSLLLLPFSCYLNYSRPVHIRFWLVLAATLIYLIGAFGTTVLGNIPLNNSLEKFNISGQSKDLIRIQRIAFESKWNNLNLLRSSASVLSFILLIVACTYNSWRVPTLTPE